MSGLRVPEGATDCHMHVFGDPAAYPPALVRAYTPTPMGMARYAAEAVAMGFSRVVIVQPSAYGTDNRCTLDALRADPAATRAVAVIDEATPEQELAAMAGMGVRGVRLNLVSTATPGAADAVALLRRTAERVGPYGMHVQIFAQPVLLAALAPVIAGLGVDVVIDHMGATDGGLAAEPAVLELLAAGKVWVKLSGANRVSRAGGDFRDALGVMRALVAANPARLVWGTDWPHIGPHRHGVVEDVVYMGHDHHVLLGLLEEACGTQAVFDRVLASNPADLYGFDHVL